MQLHMLLSTQKLGACAGTDGQDHQLITLYCIWPSNLEFISLHHPFADCYHTPITGTEVLTAHENAY